MANILQSVNELQEHLHHQITFIIRSALLYDDGYKEEAKRLSLHLRVLFHDTQASHSLLGQLNIKNSIKYWDTSIDFDPENLLSHPGLVSIKISSGEAEYFPRLGQSPTGKIFRKIPFDEWWNRAVVVDKNRHKFSRSDLVLSLAHKDGGAHVDPKIDEFYANLTRKNSMGWFFEMPGVLTEPLRQIEFASVRQIAYEALRSIYDKYPQYFPVDFTLKETEIIQESTEDIEDCKKFYGIINSDSLKQLIDEVKSKYCTKEILFEFYKKSDAHGAFDPDSPIPRILINPNSGMNEANIAFLLLNALKIKEGFPTTLKGIFSDKREHVIRELNSNLLSICVSKLLKERGFSIEEYITPTLISINTVLGNRGTKEVKRVPIRRVHYEAVVFIRLNYEATFLSSEEQSRFLKLFRDKAPLSFQIGNQLIDIIDDYNMLDPKESTIVLYECVKLLNCTASGNEVFDYEPNFYIPMIRALEQRYSFLH